jgi:mRNA deadenylase 3'-5' endonuclease subunit Ccr4
MNCVSLFFLLLACTFTPSETIQMKLRVVSYNVLSSHLASPSYFSTLNPEHLDSKNRLSAVLSKLEKQVKEKTSIICLQEVSYEWAGAFHAFFAKHGYHLVTGLYGKKFNGMCVSASHVLS